MSDRQVTERDFRMPEFRDAKVEDYEFRADGKLVRKDRWECAINSIRNIVIRTFNGNVPGVTSEFEIPNLVDVVRKMAATFEGWFTVDEHSEDPDDWLEIGGTLEVLLEDGSVLRNAAYERATKRWLWNGVEPPLRVVAWREQKD